MSQSKVIERLVKTPDEWVDKNEIVEYCGVGSSSVNQSILSLIKYGEIERKYERKYNRNNPKSNIIITYIKIDKDYYNRLKAEGLV